MEGQLDNLGQHLCASCRDRKPDPLRPTCGSLCEPPCTCEMPPEEEEIRQALDRGVLSNDQMNKLLAGSSSEPLFVKDEVRPGVRLEDTMPGMVRPRRRFKGGSYREAPEVIDEHQDRITEDVKRKLRKAMTKIVLFAAVAVVVHFLILWLEGWAL